jgi:hypothetical protein
MNERPVIVTLCGSTRFPDAFAEANMRESLAGRLVISLGLFGHADYPPGAREACADGDESTAVKQMLDRLHFAKIDLADEILVVNPGGYIGSSTEREIAYTLRQGKRVRYWEAVTR